MPSESRTGAALTAPDENVIHNIGYRGYDGPRLGRGYARRSLFVQSLRGAYGIGRSAKSKVLPMLLFGVACVPAAIVVAVAVFTKAKQLPVDSSSYVLTLQPVIGIFLAAAAPQLVSLDLRFRTVPLYFSRSITHADYVQAKLAALWAALMIFIATPVLILYVGSLLAKMEFGAQTEEFGQALAFCLLFSLLHAGVALAVAALTPRRGFGVAAVIAVLTIPYMLAQSLQGIAVVQGHEGAAGWLGLVSPGTLMDGIQFTFLGGDSNFPNNVELAGGQAPFYLLLFAALVAGAYALLLRRYRKAGL
ncbi:ABC transporter permease [Streptomyces sp. ODS28]|uniref:ABC transporter permease n=1 Tax=Streptomyces sp. ODS28 TaxID=3136688 RepID=UPI0031E9D56E